MIFRQFECDKRFSGAGRVNDSSPARLVQHGKRRLVGFLIVRIQIERHVLLLSVFLWIGGTFSLNSLFNENAAEKNIRIYKVWDISCPLNFCYYTSKHKRMQHFPKKILDFPVRKKREILKFLPTTLSSGRKTRKSWVFWPFFSLNRLFNENAFYIS
jgi:hypothetical protein